MNLKEYIDWVLNWQIDRQEVASQYFEKAQKSLDEKKMYIWELIIQNE